MRKKRLIKNTIAALLTYFVALVCGFVLPRLILTYYGSVTNGIVNSISQFLGVISFLELGMGSVVPAALYRPLAEHDNQAISKIVHSADRFYRRIAYILVIYTAGLTVLYPLTVHYDFLYTAMLIVAISINTFGQYYFGIVDRLLLSADQHGYIQSNIQTATIILNTVASVFLILHGATIQMVKLVSSLIFLIRPLYLRVYVNRHYRMERRIRYSGEPIQQKWNGIAQHVASFILDGTDNIVLTLFSAISNVSIYSVYHMVISSISSAIYASTSGAESLVGELWAKKDFKKLRAFFGWFEWSVHTAATFAFSCTLVLIVPFVSVYTREISDANYNQPVFAILLTAAYCFRCFRRPFITIILAAGHYKQTQRCFMIAAASNLMLSALLVRRYGLVGVAVGTLIAMVYQTCWMAWYNSKNLVEWPFSSFLKQVLVDAFSVLPLVFISGFFSMTTISYGAWLFLSVKISLIAAVIALANNFVFFREKLAGLKEALVTGLRG